MQNLTQTNYHLRTQMFYIKKRRNINILDSFERIILRKIFGATSIEENLHGEIQHRAVRTLLRREYDANKSRLTRTYRKNEIPEPKRTFSGQGRKTTE